MVTKNDDSLEFEGRLILHAPNVHTGGGATLLNALLRSGGITLQTILLKDARMIVDADSATNVEMHIYQPTILSRFLAERDLRAKAGRDDVVLAFGNLPPIFKLMSKTVLFLQNRYLVDPAMPTGEFSLAARTRIAIERLWLRSRLINVDQIYVQTQSMALLVKKNMSRDAEILPFAVPLKGSAIADFTSVPPEKLYDFIYVSSGEPHKNHDTLLDAWALLAETGVRPKLAVTLSAARNARLMQKINTMNENQGTDIFNLGVLKPQEVTSAYLKAHAMVFPSLGESFGLPLIEASNLGLPIVAGELDYVRDVIEPAETFDPNSPCSIARAIRRFLHLQDNPRELLDARGFLHHVCFSRI